MIDSTLCIPNKVYNNLPDFFDGLFEDVGQRERDVIFLSILTSVSACFPRVSFRRKDGKRYYLNLTTMVIGPSASNKSYGNNGKKLIEPLRQFLKNLDSNGLNKTNNTDLSGNFLIPGNNSYAGIIRCLNRSNSIGLIHESEADVIGDNLSKEWGDFSALLRQSFEHETISSFRANGDEFELLDPKLSIFLTGTPDQVKKIIPNSNNGLYSRFLYYSYVDDYEWDNPFRINDNSLFLTDKIDALSGTLTKSVLTRMKSDIEFRLSDNQIDLMDSIYKDKVEKIKKGVENIDKSFLFRSATSLVRIASILTLLRNDERIILQGKITDSDFQTSLDIIKVCIDHNKNLFDLLLNRQTSVLSVKERILKRLPDEF